MPAVPNWIAKGFVYHPRYGMRPAKAYRISSWRATRTQVVVTLDGLAGEFRLSLDTRRYAVRSHEAYRQMVLVAPDDPRVAEATRQAVVDSAVDHLKEVIDKTGLDSAMDPGDLVIAIDRIRLAAAEAMARLSEVL